MLNFIFWIPDAKLWIISYWVKPQNLGNCREWVNAILPCNRRHVTDHQHSYYFLYFIHNTLPVLQNQFSSFHGTKVNQFGGVNDHYGKVAGSVCLTCLIWFRRTFVDDKRPTIKIVIERAFTIKCIYVLDCRVHVCNCTNTGCEFYRPLSTLYMYILVASFTMYTCWYMYIVLINIL